MIEVLREVIESKAAYGNAEDKYMPIQSNPCYILAER